MKGRNTAQLVMKRSNAPRTTTLPDVIRRSPPGTGDGETCSVSSLKPSRIQRKKRKEKIKQLEDKLAKEQKKVASLEERLRREGKKDVEMVTTNGATNGAVNSNGNGNGSGNSNDMVTVW